MTPSIEEIAASDVSTLATLWEPAGKGGRWRKTVLVYLQPFLREAPPLSPEKIAEYARLDAQEAHLTMAPHSDGGWIKGFIAGYDAWRRGRPYPEDVIQRRGWAAAALHEDPAVRALVHSLALDVQSLLEDPMTPPPPEDVASSEQRDGAPVTQPAHLQRAPTGATIAYQDHDVRRMGLPMVRYRLERDERGRGHWIEEARHIVGLPDGGRRDEWRPTGKSLTSFDMWTRVKRNLKGEEATWKWGHGETPQERFGGAYWSLPRAVYEAKTGMPPHPEGKAAEDYLHLCQEQEAQAAKAFVDALGGLSKVISKAPDYVHFSTNAAAAAWAVDNVPRGGKAERLAYQTARAKTQAESKAVQHYREHRYHVAAALAAGIFIPEAVLVEYPDLHAWARTDIVVRARGAVAGTLPEWFKPSSAVWALAGTWGGVWVTRSDPRVAGTAVVFVLVPPDMDFTSLRQRFPQQGIQSHQNTVWLPVALPQDTGPLSALLDYLGAQGAPLDPAYPTPMQKPSSEKVDLLQVVPLNVGDRLLDRVIRKGMHLPGVSVRNGTQYTLGVALDGGGQGRVEDQLTFIYHYAGVLKGKVSPKEQKVGDYLIRVEPGTSRVIEISDQPWRDRNAARASKDEANRVYEALVSAAGGEAGVEAAALHAWPALREELTRQNPRLSGQSGFLDEPTQLNNYWRLRYAMVILGPATKALLPATWTNAPSWEDMAKEIVGKEAWAHKPFRVAWLAALREVTAEHFQRVLLSYVAQLAPLALLRIHAALYGGGPETKPTPAAPVAPWRLTPEAYAASASVLHPDGEPYVRQVASAQRDVHVYADNYVAALGPAVPAKSTVEETAAWAAVNTLKEAPYRKAYLDAVARLERARADQARYSSHRYHVIAALQRGDAVPAEVTAFYPELTLFQGGLGWPAQYPTDQGDVDALQRGGRGPSPAWKGERTTYRHVTRIGRTPEDVDSIQLPRVVWYLRSEKKGGPRVYLDITPEDTYTVHAIVNGKADGRFRSSGRLLDAWEALAAALNDWVPAGALLGMIDTYQTLSDGQVYQDARKDRPGAAGELERRMTAYREQLFRELSDDALASWYLLRELGRQPWPVRGEHDTSDLLRLAWTAEVTSRGIPVTEESSYARHAAAEALAERSVREARARAEAARPRTPLEQAQEDLRAVSREVALWLEGQPAWMQDLIHPYTEQELAVVMRYRTTTDIRDLARALREKLKDRQATYAV